MDSEKSLDSALDSALEPDLIISADSRILFMSDREQNRVIVAGWAGVVEYLSRIYRGSAL